VGKELMKQDERTERLFRNMKCLKNISRSLASSTSLRIEEIVHTIYEQASTVVDLSNCIIALYDDQTHELQFPLMVEAGQHKAVEASSFENSQEFRRAKAVLQSGEPLVHQTKEEAQVWWTQNQQDEPAEVIPFASWVGVPIFSDERIVGVIAVYDHSRDHFYDDANFHFLQILGNQVGIALKHNHQSKKIEEMQKEKIEAELYTTNMQLLQMFAHRIKNYLSSARIFLDYVLQEAELTPTQQEELSQVDANLKRSIAITQDLFKPYRPVSKVEAIPYALVAEAIELLEKSPKAIIENLVPEDLPKVWIEADTAVDYLHELLINALRAVQEYLQIGQLLQGYIEVQGRCNKTNNIVELHFTNNGPPIPQEQWEEIFQQFSVTSQKSKFTDNVGLGLWGTRTFFRRQGGDAYLLESNKDRTTFVVEIPLS
jgi:K+-sensing histidine kinase KdpD